jgi:hypothetical protein
MQRSPSQMMTATLAQNARCAGLRADTAPGRKASASHQPCRPRNSWLHQQLRLCQVGGSPRRSSATKSKAGTRRLLGRRLRCCGFQVVGCGRFSSDPAKNGVSMRQRPWIKNSWTSGEPSEPIRVLNRALTNTRQNDSHMQHSSRARCRIIKSY